jgi:SAM-dependent methyltransferase
MKASILKSWEINAEEWNTVIDNGRIPSRKYNSKAILETIATFQLQKVADLGCGEGWLTREMMNLGIDAHGFDATPALVQRAKEKGAGTYYILKFESIEKGKPLPHGPYDGAVFNFSIYQKDHLELLLGNVLKNLADNGVLLIQTLHPSHLTENGFTYESQWLKDSWKGLSGNFTDGHAWFARTLEDWVNLVTRIPHISFSLKEIVNDNKKPISLLLILKKKNEAN